jgi:hypothetical protein
MEFPWIDNLPRPIGLMRMGEAYRDIVDLAWYRRTAPGGRDERYGEDGLYHPPRDEAD